MDYDINCPDCESKPSIDGAKFAKLAHQTTTKTIDVGPGYPPIIVKVPIKQSTQGIIPH